MRYVFNADRTYKYMEKSGNNWIEYETGKYSFDTENSLLYLLKETDSKTLPNATAVDLEYLNKAKNGQKQFILVNKYQIGQNTVTLSPYYSNLANTTTHFSYQLPGKTININYNFLSITCTSDTANQMRSFGLLTTITDNTMSATEMWEQKRNGSEVHVEKINCNFNATYTVEGTGLNAKLKITFTTLPQEITSFTVDTEYELSLFQDVEYTELPVIAVLEDLNPSESFIFKHVNGTTYIKYPQMTFINSFDSTTPSDIQGYSVKKIDNTYYYVNNLPGLRNGDFSDLIGTWVMEAPSYRQEITLTKNTVQVKGFRNGQLIGDPITGTYSGNNGVYTMISSQGNDNFIYTGNSIYLTRPLTIVTGNDIPPVFR